MGTKTITINPITRLEGHGKIEIFLNEEGNVENAYSQVPELRGFEKFCEGRRAEDLPIITSRICGVCPVVHHFASTKALDAAFNVDPPTAAKKLRELMYCGYMVYDHTLHFYFLGAPDFVVGPDAPPAERNILGVIVATTNNSPAICISIRDAAKALIRGNEVNEGLLNRVEMAFRAYDPCLACATHFAIGQMPLEVNIYNHNKKLLKTMRR